MLTWDDVVAMVTEKLQNGTLVIDLDYTGQIVIYTGYYRMPCEKELYSDSPSHGTDEE